MKLLFAGSVPKDPSFPDANEDTFKCADDTHILAVSDGASESFDSKTWAHILTSRFVLNPKVSSEWMSQAISEYSAHFSASEMSWSKQAAYNRGSFATLLGIAHFIEDERVEVFSVGDSLVVFLDGGKLLDTFPYIGAEEFQQRPDLFSTRPELNAFLSSTDYLSHRRRTWCLRRRAKAVLLCMTDALGEWALRRNQGRHPVWRRLSQIRECRELSRLVYRERHVGRMRIDDTTLVTLAMCATDTDELPNP